MRTSMDEVTFLEFYKNTILRSSNNFQHFICKQLEIENRITFEEQRKISDKMIHYSLNLREILRVLFQRGCCTNIVLQSYF